MALKLLALLVLFIACGSAYAQQDDVLCSRYCKGFQVQDSSSKSVSQGARHNMARSERHLAPSSRQDPSQDDNFCSKYCGVMKRAGKMAGGQSSKQGGSGIFGQFPFNMLPFGGSSGGQSSDGSGSSASGSAISEIIGYPGKFVNGVFGGGQPGGYGSSQGLPFGLPFPFNNFFGGSGSGTGSSGSGSESAGGGSLMSGIMEYPQGIINGVLGGGDSGAPGFPFNMLPFGGSSGGQSPAGSGSSAGGSSSSGSEADLSGSGTRSSGGGLDFLGISERPGEMSLCEELCGHVIPDFKTSRLLNSGRKGSPNSRKERRGRQPAASRRLAAQLTRQAGLPCPDFCHIMSEITGSEDSTGHLGKSS